MTRDGRFTMKDTGQLVSSKVTPYSIRAARRSSSTLSNGAPKAGADGVLRQNGQLVGAIGLYDFNPGQNFQRYGNSGVIPNGPPEPVVHRNDIGVAQGYLEESNVNPVLQITRLIMVQRAFENISAAMRSTETTFGEAVKTLGSK